MSLQFIFEDVQGKSLDENGHEPMLMDVDNEYQNNYNFRTYLP
jgi:hypothetical protein